MDVPSPPSEERKVVSVLFADLVDSTALADRRDPEDVRATLRPLHQRLRSELERHGGAVEKFIGDAVMALFGVPVAREDDADRAVRAALAIRVAIGELDPKLQVRVGVATGEALIDLAADPRAGEGVAAGDIVNTGFRIAAAAPADGILVDETTYYATRDRIAYLPRDPADAKGKAEPVPVWQVDGLRAEPPTRALPPFVGRKAELQRLREALAAARAERAAGLVTIAGVPGIGKSRLVRELRSETEGETTWLRGRSLPYREGSVFWALAEIVKTYAGIVRDDGPDAAAQKLHAALPAQIEQQEAAWIEEHLQVLVGVGARPAEGREQAFAAWRRFFEAIARDRPLVLLFEDLHWAGEGLLEFIDHAVGAAADVPLLVVCTARPELLDRHPAWGSSYERATLLSIGPLEEAETLELMAETAERRLPEHVEAVVAERVEGNPLYAQEYARMLLDRRLLDQTDLPLPESVQAVIAARMDTLPPEEKSLVHDASVVGRTAWLGALCALSGLPRYAVEERLRTIERKQFVRREPSSTLAGESEYTFHHVLVRDVAYGQIPRAGRAERHARVAEWLESVASRREDLAEPIAHHYRCALEFATAAGTVTPELRDRARVALENAGERALRLNAHAAAAQFFAAALELSRDDDPRRPQVELLYGRALARSEHVGEEVLLKAREALVRRGDLAAGADADAELSDLLRMQGRLDESFEALERAERLLADEPPSASKAWILSKLSTLSMSAGRPEEATRVGFAALQMADELELPLVRAHSLATIGSARAALGDRGGVVDLERSIAVANEQSSPEALRGYINLGTVLANFGELEDAFGYYREGLALARRLGDQRGILWFTAERIYESYWTGRWEEAAATIQRNFANPHVPEAMRFDARLVHGWIGLARGDDDYLDDSEAALEHARAAEAQQYLFPALAFRARALAAASDRDAGELVAEALSRWTSEATSYTSFWLADLAVAASAVGRASDLVVAIGSFEAPNGWVEAAQAYASDRFAEAAARYDAIGSKPDAAYSRLRAAEASATRSETEALLGRALSFFRAVDAAAYVREAETLSAASATSRPPRARARRRLIRSIVSSVVSTRSYSAFSSSAIAAIAFALQSTVP